MDLTNYEKFVLHLIYENQMFYTSQYFEAKIVGIN